MLIIFFITVPPLVQYMKHDMFQVIDDVAAVLASVSPLDPLYASHVCSHETTTGFTKRLN